MGGWCGWVGGGWSGWGRGPNCAGCPSAPCHPHSPTHPPHHTHQPPTRGRPPACPPRSLTHKVTHLGVAVLLRHLVQLPQLLKVEALQAQRQLEGREGGGGWWVGGWAASGRRRTRRKPASQPPLSLPPTPPLHPTTHSTPPPHSTTYSPPPPSPTCLCDVEGLPLVGVIKLHLWRHNVLQLDPPPPQGLVLHQQLHAC